MTHSTKPQYFFSYAVLGSVVPFISIFLSERGLTNAQIGYVMGLSSLSVVFTPVLITLLADTSITGRHLILAMFALAGAALGGLLGANGFWLILLMYTLHSLALQPVFPLQDGIHFASQSQRLAGGLPEVSYPAVRIWGTVGYIIPSLALYPFLKPESTMSPAMVCGVLFALLGAANAFLLPKTAPARRDAKSRLPTFAAARAIRERHVLIFCIAMLLIHMAMAGYYQFYPIHLNERSGIAKRHVGLIQMIGVIVEVFFILGFPAMLKAITLRRVMYIGALAIALRLALLAFFTQPEIAISVQLLHGITVIVIHIAPPAFLNGRADDHYRNSIQGLYTMVFAGAGRVLGSFLSGALAQHSIALAFGVSAILALLAMGLFYFAFEESNT